jgi:hypothetical protein
MVSEIGFGFLAFTHVVLTRTLVTKYMHDAYCKLAVNM